MTHPVICWIVMAVTLCAWHVPAAFDLALRSPGWHKVEHACFFGASLLFWWPVVRPFPAIRSWPLWSVPLYLLAADLLNTALSAILTFSDHVLYPTLLGRAPPFRNHRPKRPELRGRDHVGARFAGLPGSSRSHRDSISLVRSFACPSANRASSSGCAVRHPLLFRRLATREKTFDLLTVPVDRPSSSPRNPPAVSCKRSCLLLPSR